MSFQTLTQTVIQTIGNWVLPPTCPLCRSVVGTPHVLCGSCWSQMRFISHPYCPQCARPFECGESDGTLTCAQCVKERPFYSRTAAVFQYDDVSRKLLLSFKHGNALHLAPLLSKWMYGIGREVLNGADWLIPVPLHWTRLIQRGYNQSSVLAKGISKLSHIPVAFDALKRVRKTPPQGIFSGDKRRQNVRNAFSVPPRYQSRVKGKRIVLVDDVRTSGATVNACAQALLAAGARDVRVLCVSRVR